MKLTGRQVVKADRVTVWGALNDAEVLRNCIEGCESLTVVEDNRFEGIVVAVVGPVKARFAGNVALSDIEPLEGYTISGEGKGGAAGFARGEARVCLSDDPEGTCVEYHVKANVGGKLAQLGARLIDATAARHAHVFFARLKNELEATDADTAAQGKSSPGPSATKAAPDAPRWAIVAIAVASAIALLIYLL